MESEKAAGRSGLSKLEFALALLPALFFAFSFALVLDWSRPGFWASGTPMSGDLIQHYAAGTFLAEGRENDLYRGFRLGEWITEYSARLDPDSTYTVVRFNYVYSPLCAGLSRWFVGFPFPPLTWLWLAFSLAAYVAAVLWMNRSGVFSPGFRLVDALWLAGFPSFFLSLVPMQNTPLTLAIASAAAYLFHRGFPFAAGLVFACASYKPQLLPLVAGFVLLGGGWRFFLGVGLGGLAWLLLGIACLGWPLHALWLESLSNMADGVQFQREGLNQSWRGFFLTLPATASAASWLWPLTSVMVTAATWWLTRRWMRHAGQPADLLWIALTWWLIVSPYVGHYELLLGIPWWFRVLRSTSDGFGRVLAALYWLTAALSILGLTEKGSNISAPLLTVWLVLSLVRVPATLPTEVEEPRETPRQN